MKSNILVSLALLFSVQFNAQSNDSLVKKNKQAIESLKNRISEVDARTALGSDAYDELARQTKIIALQADSIKALKKELLELHANMLVSKYNGSKNGSTKEKQQYDDFRNNPYINSKLGKCNCVRVYFETNEVTANYDVYRELDSIANIYQSNKKLKIRLDGHADKIGTEAINQTLSQNRAISLKKYLVEKKNIKESSITIQWHGSKMPSLDTANHDEQFLNRRVEVFVINE